VLGGESQNRVLARKSEILTIRWISETRVSDGSQKSSAQHAPMQLHHTWWLSAVILYPCEQPKLMLVAFRDKAVALFPSRISHPSFPCCKYPCVDDAPLRRDRASLIGCKGPSWCVVSPGAKWVGAGKASGRRRKARSRLASCMTLNRPDCTITLA
jgi:hypothetical protein